MELRKWERRMEEKVRWKEAYCGERGYEEEKCERNRSVL